MSFAPPPHVLDGALTIQQAQALRQPLQDALDAGACVFDLSAVTEFDTAGVQLLLAARQHAQTLGTTLALQAASAPVAEVMQRYGLDALLATPAGTPGDRPWA